jgi:hypothetical protein
MMSANVKVRALINSPSKLRQMPGEFRHRYMKDHPDANHVELKMIGKTFKRTKYQDSWKELPKDLPQNSRGAMLQRFQQHLYSKKVEQPDFDENKVYLYADHEGND